MLYTEFTTDYALSYRDSRTIELQPKETSTRPGDLVEKLPLGGFTVDLNRKITSWNTVAEKILGYSAEEVIGKDCSLLECRHCQEGCFLFRKDILMSKAFGSKFTAIREFESSCRSKEGKEVIIRVQVDHLYDKNRELFGGIELFSESELSPSVSEEKKSSILMFWMSFDETEGPVVETLYSMDEDPSMPFDKVGTELFTSTESVYGDSAYSDPQGALVRIEETKKEGYVHLDSFEDKKARGGKRLFMIVAMAPKINFFESVRIRKIFEVMSADIKERKDFEIGNYWTRVSNILTRLSV